MLSELDLPLLTLLELGWPNNDIYQDETCDKIVFHNVKENYYIYMVSTFNSQFS